MSVVLYGSPLAEADVVARATDAVGFYERHSFNTGRFQDTKAIRRWYDVLVVHLESTEIVENALGDGYDRKVLTGTRAAEVSIIDATQENLWDFVRLYKSKLSELAAKVEADQAEAEAARLAAKEAKAEARRAEAEARRAERRERDKANAANRGA